MIALKMFSRVTVCYFIGLIICSVTDEVVILLLLMSLILMIDIWLLIFLIV